MRPAQNPDRIELRSRAVAINPMDRYIQKLDSVLSAWLDYPAVPGIDLAGEAVAVGADVARFKPRDRVVAHATGTGKVRNRASEGAFLVYTVVLAHMPAAIPDTFTQEVAAFLPLRLSTTACGMFGADPLALTLPYPQPEAKAQTVLVQGGSTTVGSKTIQLAVAAGYRVITTAAPRYFCYVSGLGARGVAEMRKALAGHVMAGALAIGDGSALA